MFYYKTSLIFVFVSLLGGCSTAVTTVMKVAEVALEVSGLKKPEAPPIPEMQKPPRQVALKLHAGSNLNAGGTDKPLSMVTKIYKLKQTGAFYSASYDSFTSPEKEKALLGDDLIEVREINLIPEQLYQVTEKVPRTSSYIGIVTLFRTPATQRWRAAFSAVDAEADGITMGLHACSLTLGKGAVLDQGGAGIAMASPARCQ